MPMGSVGGVGPQRHSPPTTCSNTPISISGIISTDAISLYFVAGAISQSIMEKYFAPNVGESTCATISNAVSRVYQMLRRQS
jgi:hypothetical protein